ncbi:hypothetical protein [Cytobacillus oceanisediminis]|uniref:hypothetical protein n=1 Tax=Cytobacillus oceanisediminis TaxID=665099 RepID=UPI00254CEC07|nr:hypothetical protein [Cytobacillus oceanisediminis]MDK7664371.1 hypothetical protein [Cytobacillus oceanisediminis]
MNPFERIIDEFIQSIEHRRLNPKLDESQLKELIEYSLAISDKEWFMDLTARLKVVQKA